ncbi:MAG: hypothetical protein CM1200mP2_46620 [Planctomycetaceae bacterium]|nr:MAG: hypothetical protein CM1200mP2_46620 [Planctomycetaceae bacterium]
MNDGLGKGKRLCERLAITGRSDVFCEKAVRQAEVSEASAGVHSKARSGCGGTSLRVFARTGGPGGYEAVLVAAGGCPPNFFWGRAAIKTEAGQILGVGGLVGCDGGGGGGSSSVVRQDTSCLFEGLRPGGPISGWPRVFGGIGRKGDAQGRRFLSRAQRANLPLESQRRGSGKRLPWPTCPSRGETGFVEPGNCSSFHRERSGLEARPSVPRATGSRSQAVVPMGGGGGQNANGFAGSRRS